MPNSDARSRSAHENDQRQYRRMLQRLESFEAGDDVSTGLVGDLGTLLRALEAKPDYEWTHAFSSLCKELAILDSVAAYRAETRSSNRRAFGEGEMLRARDIAASLKRLVLAKAGPSFTSRSRRLMERSLHPQIAPVAPPPRRGPALVALTCINAREGHEG